MNCDVCGFENPENAKFCQDCGVQFPTTVQTYPSRNVPVQVKKKYANTKKVLIGVICVCLVIMIVALASIFAVFLKDGSYVYPQTMLLGYSDEDDQIIIIQDGEIIPTGIEGEIDDYICNSMDGTRGVFYVRDIDTVYAVADKKASKITSDVTSYGISVDGSRAWYTDEDDSLYLVEIDTKKVIHVADDVDTYYDICLSPNGKIVLFILDDVLTSWCDGNTWELGKNMRPYSAADSGKTIYMRNTTNSALYATDLKGTEEKKISAEVDGLIINAKGTECFFNSEGKTYISVNGGEKQKVSGDELQLLMPDQGEIMGYSYYSDYVNVNTFKNTVVYLQKSGSQAEIGYINDKYKYTRLERNASKILLAHDAKNIFYINGETLYAKTIDEDSKETEISDDVYTYAVSRNGKTVYYVDSEGDLYQISVRDNAVAQKLSSDIIEVQSYRNKAYALSDDRALYRIDGKKKARLGDDVYFEYGEYINQFLFSDEESLFISKDGSEFGSFVIGY